jgi:hypothetical protein
LLEEKTGFADAAFVDTETTGLGNGAYAFLVGVGTFERAPVPGWLGMGRQRAEQAPSHFGAVKFSCVIREKNLRCWQPLQRQSALVGWQSPSMGRSFDLPLLRARYRQNRPFLPEPYHTAALLEEGRPHLDLLLPARATLAPLSPKLPPCQPGATDSGIQRAEEDVPCPLRFRRSIRSTCAPGRQELCWSSTTTVRTFVDGVLEQLVAAYASSFEPHDDVPDAEELVVSGDFSYGSGQRAVGGTRGNRLAVERAGSEAVHAAIDGGGHSCSSSRSGGRKRPKSGSAG